MEKKETLVKIKSGMGQSNWLIPNRTYVVKDEISGVLRLHIPCTDKYARVGKHMVEVVSGDLNTVAKVKAYPTIKKRKDEIEPESFLIIRMPQNI